MRLISVILLVYISFQGCSKNNPVSTTPQNNDDFTSWSNSLTLTDVQTMYNTGASLPDARSLSSIAPFSYRDSITKSIIDTSVHYPYTYSEGLTSVKYNDSLIFQRPWGRGYMDPVQTITKINYGESGGYKLLRISNQSSLYYSGGHRLFLVKNGALKEVNLLTIVSYGLGEIIKSPRDGVIILFSYDFVRTQDPHRYLILYDLCSGKSKVFKFAY